MYSLSCRYRLRVQRLLSELPRYIIRMLWSSLIICPSCSVALVFTAPLSNYGCSVCNFSSRFLCVDTQRIMPSLRYSKSRHLIYYMSCIRNVTVWYLSLIHLNYTRKWYWQIWHVSLGKIPHYQRVYYNVLVLIHTCQAYSKLLRLYKAFIPATVPQFYYLYRLLITPRSNFYLLDGYKASNYR